MNVQAITLTTPELAVLLPALAGEALAIDESTLADLQVEDQEIVAARAALVEDGLLVCAPLEDEYSVASDLVPVLRTALAPEEVCIVRSQDQVAQESVQRIFSFAEGQITCNYVTRDGYHVFAVIETLDDVVEAMLMLREWASSQPTSEGFTRPLAELLPQAQRLTLLLCVADPTQWDSAVSSLSWIEAADGLWLVDPGAAPTGVARTVSLEDLRVQLRALLAALLRNPPS